jgi:hypothetical protein
VLWLPHAALHSLPAHNSHGQDAGTSTLKDKLQESGPAHNQEQLLLPQHASILIEARACCWLEACPPPVTTGASQLSIRCCTLKVRLPTLQSGHNVQAGVASCHVWEPCSSGGLESLLAREGLYPRLSNGQLL